MSSLSEKLHTSDPENPAVNPFVQAQQKFVSSPTIAQALANPETKFQRQRFTKTRMREYLTSLSEPGLADDYTRFHDHHLFFEQVCAGAKHHHWWVGGLDQHCCEMVGVALDMFDLYKGDLNGKITRDDIIIAIYLHDFAKIWTYVRITDEERAKSPNRYLEQQLFKPTSGAFNIVDEESKTLLELSRFNITPSEKQWSSVLFAEGGYSDRNFTIAGLSRTSDTVMSSNPLAVITHIADMYSSQILGGSIA